MMLMQLISWTMICYAIGSICPNLKHVVFNANDDLEKDLYLLEYFNGTTDNYPDTNYDSDTTDDSDGSLYPP